MAGLNRLAECLIMGSCVLLGNIHVYTNQGATYSNFYQPRRRRPYERREEEVEENRSQVRARSQVDLKFTR